MHLIGAHTRHVLVLAWLGAALAPASAPAQDFREVKGREAIPREGFQTWSLFLVTNQDWLVPENAQILRRLYDRAKAFGEVITKDHAAVWFWKKDGPVAAANVDVERAVAFCRLLGRKPSEGPYMLFTTTYPDEQTVPKNYQLISLKGRSAEEIRQLLLGLGNQLVLEGVVREGAIQEPTNSDDF